MEKPRIIPLRELPLSDNFMFGEVMRDERVCTLFLEALLGKKISRIEFIDKEQDLSDAYAVHGIRLDVYLADDKGTKYDIEMQNVSHPGLERRCRYYQSAIDRRVLEKGQFYQELSESYVIFVCNFDYYKKGLALYRRKSVVEGTDIPYEDGSHVFILNAKYATRNTPRAVADFLDYIRTNDDTLPVTSELGAAVLEKVQAVRNDDGKEVAYMTLATKMMDVREEGREEGLKEGQRRGRQEGRQEGLMEGQRRGRLEGRQEGQLEMLLRSVKALMARQQITAEEAMELLGVPKSEEERILQLLGE